MGNGGTRVNSQQPRLECRGGKEGKNTGRPPSTLTETKASYRIVGSMSGKLLWPKLEGVGSREKRGSQETKCRPGLQTRGEGGKGSVYLLTDRWKINPSRN